MLAYCPADRRSPLRRKTSMLSPLDADLGRRDPAIPGLTVLLDPDAMVDVLHHSLPGTEVGKAQITSVKYRPGSYCRVGYRLEVAGGVVELYAKAFRVDDQRQLHRVRECPAVPGVLGRGCLVLEDHATVVYIFPNDKHLKALVHLADAVA